MSNDFNQVVSSINLSHLHHSNKPNSLKQKYLANELSPAQVLEPRPPGFAKPKRDNSASLNPNGPRRHGFTKAVDTTPSPVPFHSEQSDESMDLDRPRTRLNGQISHRHHDDQSERRRSRSRGKRDQEEVIELLNRTSTSISVSDHN